VRNLSTHYKFLLPRANHVTYIYTTSPSRDIKSVHHFEYSAS